VIVRGTLGRKNVEQLDVYDQAQRSTRMDIGVW